MALPADKPPSYEEAIGQSLSPTQDIANVAPTTEEVLQPDVATTTSLPPPRPPPPVPAPRTAISLPCAVSPSTDNEPEKTLPESLSLAKAHEASGASQQPPPPGWTMPPDASAMVGAVPSGVTCSKAQEAAGQESKGPPPGWMMSPGERTSGEQNGSNPAPSFSLGPQVPPSGTWGLYCANDLLSMQHSLNVAPVSPGGLEQLINLNQLVLREKMIADEQGGSKRGATLMTGSGEAMRPLNQIQRAAVPPPRHGHQRRRPRALEVLDASGGQVIARLESTKRSDILSVEVQCPPSCRIARVESRPTTVTTEPSSEGGGGPNTQLAALVFNASEQTVFRMLLPALGEIEAMPTQQVVSSTTGGVVGTLSWAWGAEVDLLEVEFRLPGDLDVRMKLALVSLALLCMGAFSRRWNGGGRSRGIDQSLGQLNLHGPKPPRRKRHR